MSDYIKLPPRNRRFIPSQLKIEWAELKKYFDDLLAQDSHTLQEFKSWLKKLSELEAAIQEDMALRYIRMSCDTANKEKRDAFEYFVSEIQPHLAKYGNQLNKKIAENPLSLELEKEVGYNIYLRDIKGELELFREENILLKSKMQVEEQKYGAITGALSIQYKGKEFTLQQASNFLKSKNRSERKEVFELIQKARKGVEKELHALFQVLVELRNKVAINAGFENYRDYKFKELARYDYTAEDCFQFHESIEQAVMPLLEKMAEERRKKMGIDKLRPYDMAVDAEGRDALIPFHGADDLIAKSKAAFASIDSKLAGYLETMNKHGLFDLESRKGKAPGGYNYPLAETGMPFIFMNSSDSFRDLTTMVHEGGHAIHTFLSNDLELNSFKSCPSEVAELASMSMELISMEHWDHIFDNPEDLKRAKAEQLEGVIETLPWIATIDAFQQNIYLHPEQDAQDRNTLFEQIYAKFRVKSIDWSGYEPYRSSMWQKQLHLFEVPFYYIEYGMAQLGAIAMWKNYKENPKTGLENYYRFLNLGNTKSIPELYEAAGIEFDFRQNYVKDLIEFVELEYKKLL